MLRKNMHMYFNHLPIVRGTTLDLNYLKGGSDQNFFFNYTML